MDEPLQKVHWLFPFAFIRTAIFRSNEGQASDWTNHNLVTWFNVILQNKLVPITKLTKQLRRVRKCLWQLNVDSTLRPDLVGIIVKARARCYGIVPDTETVFEDGLLSQLFGRRGDNDPIATRTLLTSSFFDAVGELDITGEQSAGGTSSQSDKLRSEPVWLTTIVALEEKLKTHPMRTISFRSMLNLVSQCAEQSETLTNSIHGIFSACSTIEYGFVHHKVTTDVLVEYIDKVWHEKQVVELENTKVTLNQIIDDREIQLLRDLMDTTPRCSFQILLCHVHRAKLLYKLQVKNRLTMRNSLATYMSNLVHHTNAENKYSKNGTIQHSDVKGLPSLTLNDCNYMMCRARSIFTQNTLLHVDHRMVNSFDLKVEFEDAASRVANLGILLETTKELGRYGFGNVKELLHQGVTGALCARRLRFLFVPGAIEEVEVVYQSLTSRKSSKSKKRSNRVKRVSSSENSSSTAFHMEIYLDAIDQVIDTMESKYEQLVLDCSVLEEQFRVASDNQSIFHHLVQNKWVQMLDKLSSEKLTNLVSLILVKLRWHTDFQILGDVVHNGTFLQQGSLLFQDDRETASPEKLAEVIFWTSQYKYHCETSTIREMLTLAQRAATSTMVSVHKFVELCATTPILHNRVLANRFLFPLHVEWRHYVERCTRDSSQQNAKDNKTSGVSLSDELATLSSIRNLISQSNDKELLTERSRIQSFLNQLHLSREFLFRDVLRHVLESRVHQLEYEEETLGPFPTGSTECWESYATNVANLGLILPTRWDRFHQHLLGCSTVISGNGARVTTIQLVGALAQEHLRRELDAKRALDKVCQYYKKQAVEVSNQNELYRVLQKSWHSSGSRADDLRFVLAYIQFGEDYSFTTSHLEPTCLLKRCISALSSTGTCLLNEYVDSFPRHQDDKAPVWSTTVVGQLNEQNRSTIVQQLDTGNKSLFNVTAYMLYYVERIGVPQWSKSVLSASVGMQSATFTSKYDKGNLETKLTHLYYKCTPQMLETLYNSFGLQIAPLLDTKHIQTSLKHQVKTEALPFAFELYDFVMEWCESGQRHLDESFIAESCLKVKRIVAAVESILDDVEREGIDPSGLYPIFRNTSNASRYSLLRCSICAKLRGCMSHVWSSDHVVSQVSQRMEPGVPLLGLLLECHAESNGARSAGSE